jgi:hypothetical protein
MTPVVLLLPSADLDESVRVLRERGRCAIGGVPFPRYVVAHPCNRALATVVVTTDGRTPQDVCTELLERW